MCDYSLMTIHNRLAMEGEELVAHRFRSGSIGLVSSLDFADWQTRRPARVWERFKDYFSPQTDPTPVVCIPPGARLLLHAFGSCEKGTFTQISPESNRYRCAEFRRGQHAARAVVAGGTENNGSATAHGGKRPARSGSVRTCTHNVILRTLLC